MTRVLVTGCTGFVGRELCEALCESGFGVRGVLRRGRPLPVLGMDIVEIDGIDGSTDWSSALTGVDAVVHLAAKVHSADQSRAHMREYVDINAQGTRVLAAASAAAGVRRFIYLSSVKVNGAASGDRPFRSSDEVRPDGPYGESKWLGEKYVAEATVASDMEGVVVRPPLVYGPGVKANFLALMRWIDKRRPLPFGAIRNRRSLVSVWNLTDFILALLRHEQPVQGTWMVSDGLDLSTPELVRRIGAAMKRDPLIFPVPPFLLRSLGAVFGAGAAVDRLCGSLTVDLGETTSVLGWRPPISIETGIFRTVSAYLHGKHS